MAQPITCDVHERQHLADVLVSQIATGDTMAACAEGYLELCRAMVEAADAPEVQASTADALTRLEGAGDQAGPDDSQALGFMREPWEGAGDQAEAPTSAESSAEADPPAELPTRRVRRSESGGLERDPTGEAEGPPGGSSEGVEDPELTPTIP